MAAGTGAHKHARSVIDSGGLVSDDVVLTIRAWRMARADVTKGTILDGLPRTDGQAAALGGLSE